jgi:hypothetical protein
MASNSTTTRLMLFEQLRHFFEAYRMLTEQLVRALDQDDAAMLGRMTELRRETLQQIDRFEGEHPELLSVAPQDESDPESAVVRQQIREIMASCQALEVGMPARLAALRDSLKNQANGLARGQRGLKGYAQGGASRSRYVEETK